MHCDYLNYTGFDKLDRPTEALGIQYVVRTHQKFYEERRCWTNVIVHKELLQKPSKYQHVDLPT